MQPTAKPIDDFRVKLSHGWHWVIVDRLEGYAFEGGCGLVLINPALSQKKFLDNSCHEVLHRALPNATEATVERVANDLTKVLWRMGWRLP